MAQIEVEVAGHARRLACEDGQEARLERLAAMVDSEAQALAANMPTLGDAQLLLMAAVMLADRLSDATDALREAEKALSAGAPPRDDGAPAAPPAAGQRGLFDGDEAAAALMGAVSRLERLVETREADPAAPSRPAEAR